MTPVHVFESHDEACHRWREAGVAGATLVHVDAHHDLAWLDDEIHLHIGNYICQAMKDGLCGDVWWVVPDGTLAVRRARLEIRRQLRVLRRDYRGAAARVRGDQWSIQLLGRRVTICELADLPALPAPVLLDVDTDYFVTDSRSFSTGLSSGAPWILPEAFVARLAPRLPSPAVTTIAYSVEGGYTPLQWRFIGDELAERLKPLPSADRLQRFARLHDAHRFIADGKHAEALRACKDAGDSAAASFARAMSFARQGRFEDAREARACARQLDPAYATAYDCCGPSALEAGRLDEAQRAFEESLRLDPSEASPYAGLARIAAARRRWTDAESAARTAIARGLDAPDLFRLLARALERQGRTADAIAALKQSLKAGLHGRATAHGALAARTTTRLPVHDTGHARAYAWLAALEAREGRVADAIAALRLAISGGYRDPSAHARLARLYSAQHRWRAAAREAGRAVALLPESSGRSLMRTWQGLAARLEALA